MRRWSHKIKKDKEDQKVEKTHVAASASDWLARGCADLQAELQCNLATWFDLATSRISFVLPAIPNEHGDLYMHAHIGLIFLQFVSNNTAYFLRCTGKEEKDLVEHDWQLRKHQVRTKRFIQRNYPSTNPWLPMPPRRNRKQPPS